MHNIKAEVPAAYIYFLCIRPTRDHNRKTA